MGRSRQWAGGGTSRKKYKMPKSQRPDGAVAGSSKRLAARFYKPTEDRPLFTRAVPTLDEEPPPRPSAGGADVRRDHLFKVCPGWKG